MNFCLLSTAGEWLSGYGSTEGPISLQPGALPGITSINTSHRHHRLRHYYTYILWGCRGLLIEYSNVRCHSSHNVIRPPVKHAVLEEK